MRRGRPHLDPGTYGDIATVEAKHSTKARPVYVARVRFRDSDGTTRSVTKSGQTKSAATKALKEALTRRQRIVQASAVSAATTVAELSARWLTRGRAVNNTEWATNTRARYELSAAHIVIELGGVHLNQLSRGSVSTALETIQAKHGPRSAAVAKSALSGMCKLALTFDALDINPVRDSVSVGANTKSAPRALTVAETDDLCDRLRTHPQAIGWDLPDIVEWMLATGCRIGEACAARPAVIDVEAGTWEINATAVRVKGVGMIIQPRPKTAAGWRVLALPSCAVAIVQRRASEMRLTPAEGVIFGSPAARSIRDPSNTAGDLRRVLDDLGYGWVSSHAFRKTVATRLDDAGMSARQIADQLGHAKPSTTQDVYLGRRVVSAEAARILDR